MLQASVIVATRDRAELLDECLSYLAVQDLSSDDYEVVVVDNGSADDTPRVAQRWLDRSRIFRYCTAPIAGLSIARNAGIAAARANVVAFIDDDARPEAGWLRALIAGYERSPAIVAVGGLVELSYLRERPWWLSSHLETWYSALDLGDRPSVLDVDETLSGANMSFRKDLLVGIGGFPTDLGRVGTSLLSNEETHVQEQLRAAGGVIGYEPRARVAHIVHNDRLKLRWLLARTLAQGRSDFVQDQHREVFSSRTKVVQAAGAAARQLAVAGWRADLRRLRGGEPPTVLVDSLARRSRDAGYAWTALCSLASQQRLGS